ncbi:MAG: DUF1573 domain-containing protein [Chitinispirillaceae bacterium]|nr:DUF1573 domain-containing protein [Chitinispirillaceae bacterium]
MVRHTVVPAVMLLGCSLSLSAGPKITFDTKAFNCDTAYEGKTEKVNAVFRMKNTGDAPLVIERVRPGCGCTVVKYDTLVKPGAASIIKAEVRIKGYKAGFISKTMVVTSNAVNEKEVRLSINATIVAPIELSDHSIAFGGYDTLKTRTVTLISRKHDLAIRGVYFKQAEKNAPGWIGDLRLALDHAWSPLDSLRADGARYFRLIINAPAVASTVTGEIIIKTNHPEKPELKIQMYCAAPVAKK